MDYSHAGSLSLKDTYQFKTNPSNNLDLARLIWNISIPPSTFLFVWKLKLSKVPTDDILTKREIFLFPSKYVICGIHEEIIDHLFFHCTFSQSIWQWLASVTHHILHYNILEIWEVCYETWSKQTRVVILSAVINTFNIIQYSRNQKKFNNKSTHWKSAVNLIISSVNMTGNSTKESPTCNIMDFRILKAFKVSMLPPKATRIV